VISASILGYLEGGDATGSRSLASLTEQAASQCPHTQIVLSGYSQGAQVVHNGAALLKPSTAARVKAVVLFGDPYKGRPIPNISPSIVDTFCFATDLICYDTIFVDPAHLAYSIDAVPAANFVASKVAL
jgi:cutinase